MTNPGRCGGPIAAALLVCVPGGVRAEVLEKNQRVASAARRVGDVQIDGVLDEAAWKRAPVHGDFWQRDPNEGEPPELPTEVVVLYDDEAVYVGVRAMDPEPAKIVGLLTRRDQDSPSDWIGVAIDSYHDRRSAFLFKVNPAGVERDARIHDDNIFDYTWNGVWESAAAITARGWSVEIRIPFSQLRFADTGEPWGLQVSRLVQRTRETTYFSPLPKSEPLRWVSLAGSLEGLDDVTPPTRLEIRPYVLGGVAARDVPEADPFAGDLDGEARAGLDVKLGLSSAFTLALALNPDFGQVEADPSVVNLGASEIFFEEKRPFFLEGAEIFNFGLATNGVQSLFYSRRIGAAPRVSYVGQGDFVSEPDATTIYGAAKVSGKTDGGWIFGALSAVTGEEKARIAVAGEPIDERVIEPLTNYTAMRTGKELRAGRTVIDLAATSVVRKLGGTGLEPLLPDRALSGGASLVHKFGDDEWRIDARLYGSHVHGDEQAIAGLQRSRYHYFHRPGADHVDYDPTRESLSGFGGWWEVWRPGGETWRGGIGGDSRSPGFETNDLGYQVGADYYKQFAWFEHVDQQPGRYLRSHSLGMDAAHQLDYGGQSLFSACHFYGNAVLDRYWSGNFFIGGDLVHQENELLRGGPAVAGDHFVHGNAGIASDSRKKIRGQLSGFAAWEPASRSWQAQATLAATAQLASNFDVTLGPTIVRRIEADQYVTEVMDTSGTPRYILARIDQTTAALTLRVNYTVTPELSLQLYAQPYIGTGHYTDYKEPEVPRAGDRDHRYHVFSPAEIRTSDGVYSIDRDGDGAAELAFAKADFSFRELRSNFVVRWEYRPGSTLFFVWSHGRTSFAPEGRFHLGDDLGALFDETGEHVVLAKLNYWFGL